MTRSLRSMVSAVPALFWAPVSALQPAYSSTESTILQQCRDLSLADNDIHNCLDNYLDLMDENLADLLDFITAELAEDAANPDALQALQRSHRG